MGVELSAEELDAYLLAAPRAILCVPRRSGAPIATPMWFGWVEGRIVMHTLASSPKVQHIRRASEVTCLVESGEHYYTLKGAELRGPCTVEDEPEAVRDHMTAINRVKPFYEELRPDEWPPHLQRHYEKPRVALLLTPTRIRTWDFAKIRR